MCLGGPVCGHYTVLVDLSVGTTLSWWTRLWALHCLGGTCLWALHCLGGPVCGHYTVHDSCCPCCFPDTM